MEQIVEGVRRLLPYSMQRVLPFLQAAHETADQEETKVPDEPVKLAPGLHKAPRRYFHALAKALPEVPPEIILRILDEAGLYTRYVTARLPSCSILQHTNYTVVARTPRLSSYGVSSLRSITFRFSSHDQGFSGEPAQFHGTFEHSHTWFEAAVTENMTAERLQPPPVQRLDIQHNRHASRQFEEYEVTFAIGEKPFEHLAEGQGIVLLACALYPAWRNVVEWAEIELAWVDTFDEGQPPYFLDGDLPV
ncbi:hypothetical protein BCR37DRAFT_394353 [Protomyces lactucae-debilis]|uniref:Uncharacterized protein n=1 Tax=Protomyces lactucae-debilis TaxID=2754530 RepID=A0A1Y2F524_PROLT|nr:uncharacterized protein BCR37DRAFT_394353 [Protomyces lactucae-debilis]ORY79010.1 hypothetical protein BCR37DRAFT_394353 [Protomyces lactucae-debilis]